MQSVSLKVWGESVENKGGQNKPRQDIRPQTPPPSPSRLVLSRAPVLSAMAWHRGCGSPLPQLMPLHPLTVFSLSPSYPIPVGAGYGAYAYGLEAGYHTRRTIKANTDGVEIEGGMKYTTFGSSNVNSSNGSLIPVVIYGIKGVADVNISEDTPDVEEKTATCGTFLCGEVVCGQQGG